MSAPDLSIVIPAYNEERRIVSTLEHAREFLDAANMGFEIIVVDDGSRDNTCDRVETIARNDARISLVRQPVNLGKGAAVRRGMSLVQGRLALFMDADLATPMSELPKLLAAIETGAAVAIGSRGTPESQVRQSQGIVRENMGKTFNRIVQAIAIHGIQDTQCGFKLFTDTARREIFRRASVDRFAFDVELLLIAHDLGLRIAEVPIAWHHVPDSRVSPVRDATRMLFDVLLLRARMRRRARV